MLRSNRSWVFALSLMLLHAIAGMCAELTPVNVDEFPQTVINLPNGDKAVVVKYNDHNWRKVEATVLAGNAISDTDICFEAKVESILKPDRVRLFGRKGTIIIEEPNKFKTASTSFQLADNAWFCGTLKPVKNGKGIEFYVVDMLKLPGDVQRFEEKIESLVKHNDSDGLLALGRTIEQERNDPNFGFRFEDFEKLGALKQKSFENALEIKEKDLKQDDADSVFALAAMWRDLAEKRNKFHELVLKCLRIDPDHSEASRIAQSEMSLTKFENKWLGKEEIDKILADRELEARNRKLADQHAKEQGLRLMERAATERPVELVKYQSALRTGDSGKRDSAMKALAEQIQKSPDSGFGEEGIDIIVNICDSPKVTAALEIAGKSPHAEVRKLVLEALAWRAAHNDSAALDLLSGALASEKDESIAKAGVGALVALGGHSAASVLTAALKTSDRGIQGDIIGGLKFVTSKQFENKSDWEKWWDDNKSTFK